MMDVLSKWGQKKLHAVVSVLLTSGARMFLIVYVFFCIGSEPLLKFIVVEDLVNTISNNSVASLIFLCHFVPVLHHKHPLSVA
jgi:hypothetical protein